jgi:hypothetical protein
MNLLVRLLLTGMLLLVLPSACFAELRLIGVRVETVSDTPVKVRVSIYSDVAKENKRNLTLDEAAAILREAEGWGSSVLVGIVANDVPLQSYLPLLTEISKNGWLELTFVEGDKPSFLHDNLRRMMSRE